MLLVYAEIFDPQKFDWLDSMRMGAIKEVFEDYKYSGDDVESAPEVFMDFLPEFPEEMKVGSLSLGPKGVLISFSPEGFVLSSSEITTPIKSLVFVN